MKILSLLCTLLFLINAAYSENPTATKNSPAGNSLTLSVGSAQTFKINAADMDGDLKGAEWYINGNLQSPVHTLTGSSTIDSWTYTFSNSGVYTIEVVVFDNKWAYSSAVSWTVTVGTNTAPTATKNSLIITSGILTVGDSQIFKINAADIDGNLQGAEWYVNGILQPPTHILTGSSSTDSWTYTFFNKGTYTISAIVFDDRWEYSNTVNWTITVNTNNVPEVTKNSPIANSLTISPGSSQTFKINAVDVDGNLKGAQWYVNSILQPPAHTLTGASGTDNWTYTFPTPGTYTVSARVHDNKLAYGNAISWTVTVGTNSPPTITKGSFTIGSSPIIIGNSQTFKINAEDVDGNLQGAEWYLNGALQPPVHTLAGSSSTDSWTYTFPVEGSYTIDAKVFDAHLTYGNTVSWTVTVGTSTTKPNHPVKEFFDDFCYTSNADVNLTNFGWHITDGISAPPNGAMYKKDNISFVTDPINTNNKWMLLKTNTSNTFQSMELARIQSEIIFHEGTYAARVYLDNSPVNYQDGNVEAFYSINELQYPNDPNYSECDFEYLPWNVWEGDDDHTNMMYLATYETYQASPWDPDYVLTSVNSNYAGWHTLLFQVTNKTSVKYYIDGVLKGEHSLSNKNHNVYPESLMQIAFANWISTDTDGSGLGNLAQIRSSTMKVDWVYHSANTELTTNDVALLVSDFRNKNSCRHNSMDATPSLVKNNSGYSKDLYSAEENKEKAIIYPNPAKQKITIELNAGSKAKSIQITNSIGQIVYTRQVKIASQLEQIDISNLKQGIYFIKIETDNGDNIIKKIAKE